MHPIHEHLTDLSRRQFFGRSAGTLSGALGATALSDVLGRSGPNGGGALGQPHFPPRAKRVIYLHMMGAPSQLDLFDYKPKLRELAGQDLRKMPGVQNNQRITGMTSGQATLPLVPSRFRFDRHDNEQDGAWVSELYPFTGRLAKKLCIVKTVHTEAINHEPGVAFMQTGSQIPGRPSFGSWLSYGLGALNRDLPSFVVLISMGFGNMQALSARLWGSGFLPSEHQGVRFRSGEDAVLFLNDPPGVTRADRRRMLDAAAELNEAQFQRSMDPEVRTRIQQAEMAYRMQMSVPELTDISGEDEKTLEMYGPDVHKPGSFARNCLLARRMVERDVRFVQLYHRGWDAHGNLPREIRQQCLATDQPQAALVEDLDRRGLLEDTVVVWGGEFGRTAYCQGGYSEETYGRDHHGRCFTMWMTGGGIRPGIVHGETDEVGYNIARDPVHVHDLHATLMRVLGVDHERLTFRFQGRDYRLTDIAGQVVQPILA
ncbi:MAG: DUF1501 domain-containing protein [Planctomycetota bacterium]|nr:DUF1501 domain-containing protein [Planctomycetota bacterium]MDA0934466.1 DUF1501 domain-containing protein [Planctomycetota bacterium]